MCQCTARTQNNLDIPRNTAPDEPCVFCAEKHFSTAITFMREIGYVGINRKYILGEIVAAQWHIYQISDKGYEVAEDLRDLRHLIQLRREKEITSGKLAKISDKIDVLINNELSKKEKEQ